MCLANKKPLTVSMEVFNKLMTGGSPARHLGRGRWEETGAVLLVRAGRSLLGRMSRYPCSVRRSAGHPHADTADQRRRHTEEDHRHLQRHARLRDDRTAKRAVVQRRCQVLHACLARVPPVPLPSSAARPCACSGAASRAAGRQPRSGTPSPTRATTSPGLTSHARR